MGPDYALHPIPTIRRATIGDVTTLLGLTAEIDELFVRPRVRAIGIGGKLLQAAEAAFIAAGCTNVVLQLARSNDSGRAFYIRHGYSPRPGYELLDKILIAG